MIARVLVVCSTLLAGMALAQEPSPAPPVPPVPVPPPAAVVPVVLHTLLGDIRIELEKDRAPVTVANFLRYVDARRFDGINFYRAVVIGEEGKFGLLQAGLQGNREKLFPPIAHEAPAATGLSHVDGAISMARHDPGSATADFFIVVGDLVSLDGKAGGEDQGYAVFGRVVEGMDLVRQLLQFPRDPEAGADSGMKGQMLAPPVRIVTVRRAD